ncbi:MAG: PhnD/SsuA/transferrin family substrate-binding protein [Puniceicoccaceae bacterium]
MCLWSKVRSVRRNGPRCLFVCLYTLGFVFAGLPSLAGEAGEANAPAVKVIVSESTLININKNDAKAAFKIYMNALGKGTNIRAIESVMISPSARATVEELKSTKNNLVSLSLEEYIECPEGIFGDELLIGGSESKVGTHFVLLVREDSGIDELSDLEGRELIRLAENRTQTSDAWFECLLTESGLNPSGDFLVRSREEKDLSRTVLPVFFGKVAACIITENGFDLMGELNPQIHQKLKVLARSAKIVPAAMVMQADFDEKLKTSLLDAMEILTNETEGQQVLTLFRESEVSVINRKVFDDSLELYKHWLQVAGSDAVKTGI